jgi:hypothetical protein
MAGRLSPISVELTAVRYSTTEVARAMLLVFVRSALTSKAAPSPATSVAYGVV